ncbi:MAG: DUF4190 domain-containing protein [Clostridia bacterium]|nr:DUF4190 domain-containing protein [Clostridia bacterium]
MSRTCKYCGNVLEDGDNFCQKCGAVADSVQDNEPGMSAQANANVTNNFNQQQNTANSQAYAGKTSGIAIGGFVCSIVGLFVAGVILGIIAISLGAAALNHMKTFTEEKGKGLATAAIAIGVFDIIGAIVGAALIVGNLF